MLVLVPALITVGVTVVEPSGPDIAAMASTWWASSTPAFAPFSGSRPAWAAMPWTATSYRETPLRAVFSAPPSALASRTSAAAQSRALCSMSAREVGEPSSSSPVTSTHTPSTDASERSAWNIWTRPAFMSNTPGPRATPPVTAHGCARSDPIGQTVSWWPRSRTRGVPKLQRRCVTPPSTIGSGGTPRCRAPRAATTEALAATASWSEEKDSRRTSSSRSSSMTGRSPGIT